MKYHPLRSAAVLVSLFMSLSAHAMAPRPKPQPGADLAKAPADGKGVYAFDADDIDGKKRSLGEFKGKVLLIMNTASKCGTTPQYANLESLYKKNKDRGFVAV